MSRGKQVENSDTFPIIISLPLVKMTQN